MSLEQSIQDLITASGQQTEAANQLNQTVNDKIASIDAYSQAKSAELEAEVDGFYLKAIKPSGSMAFDNTLIHTVSSLSAPTDAADVGQTEWVKVTAIHDSWLWGYPEGLGINTIECQRAFATAPGYGETPQYGNDISIKMVEAIITDEASHADIASYMAANPSFVPTTLGQWAHGVQTAKIPSTNNMWGQLWVRFVNRLHHSAQDPNAPSHQDIAVYGGNTAFAINNVCAFEKL